VKIRAIHSRELPVPAERVGALLANALELRLARHRGLLPPARVARRGTPIDRIAGSGGPLAAGVLAALAALHAAWALGWRWPGGSDRELAERVLGASERERLRDLTGRELPPEPAVWAVAATLLTASGIVASAATGARPRALRRATWAIAGVLVARGAYGISAALNGGVDELYERLDLTLYSPLCLGLGGVTAAVAARAE
jgi:Protein of unknown function (DUF3995)